MAVALGLHSCNSKKDINHLLFVSLPSATVSHLNVRLAVSFDSWPTDSVVSHTSDAIGAGDVCQLGTLSQVRNLEGGWDAWVREEAKLKG